MLRITTLFCAAIILTGCWTVTEMTFQSGESDDKMIVGCGKGDVQTATIQAWKDARQKLDISGLGEKYGLAEKESKYQANTAIILFQLVPLNEEETQTTNKNKPEKNPAQAL